ncbi:MAG: flavodoxin/ferredoxin-dependent (E)-4-hydroxy-3-methylbut-2-enyl-diphosphate synthase [Planctomycetia bacterium]|nr:flavodoxin/ferredoxin-dependent (E)-4-hydroxy-3-methylbut-2-enyl-diphosphate synthase [Planctomycetia bacterium]
MGNATRKIKIGSIFIGGDAPIIVQSMCSTKTTDVEATVRLVNCLEAAGAGLVRLAIDSENDVHALEQIRKQTTANLSVDLQENYRLAAKVAPWVDKIRYNPGHLHHLETSVPWQDKVRFLITVAQENDVALRIGVNCGSLDPAMKSSELTPSLASALEHAEFLDSCGFTRYCVSIKDSDPARVVETNRVFAKLRPDVPLHLGVTEAGMPPWGVIKSRCAMELLLSQGIGDTLRVSLTVDSEHKTQEVQAGQEILKNVANGTIIDVNAITFPKLNIISCPSCSRVQNASFVELAQKVREAVEFAKDTPLTIAVMGCRVNGPGETDNADIGLWCGPDRVHLKEGTQSRGVWKYDEIIPKLLEIIREKVHNI